jgi:hypothetical protein
MGEIKARKETHKKAVEKLSKETAKLKSVNNTVAYKIAVATGRHKPNGAR